MYNMLDLQDLTGYIEGTIPQPDPKMQSESWQNWMFNNKYVKALIDKNILDSQAIHLLSSGSIASEVWNAFKAIHKVKTYQGTAAIQCKMFGL